MRQFVVIEIEIIETYIIFGAFPPSFDFGWDELHIPIRSPINIEIESRFGFAVCIILFLHADKLTELARKYLVYAPVTRVWQQWHLLASIHSPNIFSQLPSHGLRHPLLEGIFGFRAISVFKLVYIFLDLPLLIQSQICKYWIWIWPSL